MMERLLHQYRKFLSCLCRLELKAKRVQRGQQLIGENAH